MRNRREVSAFLGILKGGLTAGGRTTQCPTTRPDSLRNLPRPLEWLFFSPIEVMLQGREMTTRKT